MIDASGDPSEMASRTALARLAQAGVIPTSTNAVLSEVHRTWNRPEAAELAKLYALMAPNYAAVIESYNKAQEVARQQPSTGRALQQPVAAVGVRPCGSDPMARNGDWPFQRAPPGDILLTALVALRGFHAEGLDAMPRSPRQDHEGAWQHVMNRGIDRQRIFRGDDDRQIFYDCLAAAMPRYGVQVHAGCLLDNHFHLLLFSESGRLSDAMRFLGGRFTQRINYRDSRDGPIFRGRFTSVAIESDAHLMQVSRYIHRNPVEAGLAGEPWLWPWSSAHAYLGLTRTPAWLHTEAILEMLGPHGARQKYREYLGAETDAATQATLAGGVPWGQPRRV